MGLVENNIKYRLNRIGSNLGWLADQIGMSKSGFYKMIETGSMKVETLQKISTVLNVPINDLFLTEAEIKNKAKDSLYSIIGNLTMLWGAASYFHSLGEIVEKARKDKNYTKMQMVAEIEEFLKDVEEIVESMDKLNNK